MQSLFWKSYKHKLLIRPHWIILEKQQEKNTVYYNDSFLHIQSFNTLMFHNTDFYATEIDFDLGHPHKSPFLKSCQNFENSDFLKFDLDAINLSFY